MEGKSNIKEKAIAVFRYHAQVFENQQIDELPGLYEINGTWLGIDMENGTITIDFPSLFNVRNPVHIEAIEIAQEIYTELACLRDLLFLCEDGEINDDVFNRHDGFSEAAVAEYWDWIQADIFTSPFYHSAPRLYRRQLDTVILKFAEYVAALPERIKVQQIEVMRACTNHGYVYLVQSPTGSYKIGRTKDPDNRMKTFSVKLPFEVDYVCLLETADMYALERDLHRKFASKRINGEWFMLAPADVAHIKELVV